MRGHAELFDTVAGAEEEAEIGFVLADFRHHVIGYEREIMHCASQCIEHRRQLT